MKQEKSPCVHCPRREKCENPGFACRAYRAYINASWARFHRLIRRYMDAPAAHVPENAQSGKFRYAHPVFREDYLKKSPCESCPLGSCGKPCRRYLRWYDAKMELLRRRLQ